MAGEAELGEGRGVWGSHLPSDRPLGEGSLHLGLKTKEKQPQIPVPHVSERAGDGMTARDYGALGSMGWHCTRLSHTT